MTDYQLKWQAVEVGADEWFLGKPDGPARTAHGYDPFYDCGNIPKDLIHRIVLALNVQDAAEQSISLKRLHTP